MIAALVEQYCDVGISDCAEKKRPINEAIQKQQI